MTKQNFMMKFDLQQLPLDKLRKWMVPGASIFFALLIGIEILSLRSSSELADSAPVVAPRAQAGSPVDYRQITKAALFGHYLPKNLNQAGIKQSLLNVELIGILLSTPLKESQVIVKESNGEQKVYGLGETLPGGAVIKKIMANSILVERNGELERLDLPRDQLNFQPVEKPMKEGNHEAH